MSIDAYRDQLTGRFRSFDADGDGSITEADFEAIAERMIETFGAAADSPKAAEMRAAARVYWRKLAESAGAGESGLTLEQYVDGVQRQAHSSPGRAAEMVGPWLTAHFRLADTDDTGYLDKAEHRRMLEASGFDPASAEAAFDIMDANGDGRISADEFYQVGLSYYTSTGTGVPAAQTLVTEAQ